MNSLHTLNKYLGISVVGLMSATLALGAPRRQALVIGNDSYPGNALQNARHDAQAIAEKLAALGYITSRQLDADRKTMSDSVDSFANGLHPGDTALIYYSGHGMQVNGENYLIPIDFRLSSADDVRQAYSLSLLLHKLIEHGATTQVIILDACRDNPFSGSRSLRGGWAPMVTSSGTFLAFGTAPGSTASDNPGETHGLFTKAVLKSLSDPSLDINAMFQQVRGNVVRESHALQTPWIASSLMGSLHIDPKFDSAAGTFVPVMTEAFGTESSAGPLDGSSRTLNPAAQTVSTLHEITARPASRKIALSSVPILINQGLLLAKQKNYDEAVRSLSAAVAADPTSGIAMRILGLILHLMGRGTDAVQTLNQAISMNPADSNAYYYRCLALSSSDPLSAVRDCEASVGLEPGIAATHLALSQALLSLGQTEQALTEANKALQLDGKLSLGYSMRGKVLRAIGNSSAAQRDFHAAMSLSQSSQ